LIGFQKNPEISNFINVLQWEVSCSLRTDRQTDGRKLRG